MGNSSARAEPLALGRSAGQIRISAVRDYGIVVAFLALFVTLSIASDVFFTWDNMVNLAFQAAPVGIMACGGTLVFIGGGFDLSVGLISSFAGVVAAKAIVGTGLGVWPAFILGALTGLGFGIGNGLLVNVARINPFIATLATSIIIRGLGIAVTGGFLISIIENPGSDTLGLGDAWGINFPIFVWL